MGNELLTGFLAGQSDNGGNNGNSGGFFGNEGLWAVIILAIIFGWGNNGNGFGGNRGGAGNGGDNSVTYVPYPAGFGGFGGGGYPTEAILQRSLDTQTIIGKLDGLNSGVCSLGYDQLVQQNGTNNLITTTGYNMERAIQANTIANMQQFNAMSAAQQACCCENRQMIADLKYDMATSDCSIKTLVNQLAQQIMWGQQNGIRDLTELISNKFCQLEMSQKDAVIADLRTQLAQCGDQNMANSIVARLSAVINPPVVPAYPAANPNGMGNWAPQVLANGGWNQGCGCGCNNGCGC